MRTLTTSFSDILKKDMNANQAFIIRVEAIKKDDLTSRVFYLSNDFHEVDYQLAEGIISDYGAIKESVDFYTGSFSFGGFDINIQQFQDKIDDLVSDYYFYNRKIEIYYWVEGQDRRTNQDIVFNNARLVANNDILLSETDFEIEINFRTSTIADRECLLSSEDITTGDYGAILFTSSTLRVGLDDGAGGYDSYNTTFTFVDDTEYLIKIKKDGIILFYDINGTTDTDTTTAIHNISIKQLGALRAFVATYNFNGTIRSAKIWSGGDRNTGTLVCNLAAHENDDSTKENVLDLADNFTFTKYVSGAGTITYTDNLQRLYKGKLENRITDLTKAKLSVINDTTLLDTVFPPLITDTDAGYATGKIAQRVYGICTTSKGILSSNGTNAETNNLTKAYYCGIIDGKHRWILAGNGADVTITNYWFYDSKYKRHMLSNDTFTNGVDSQGNRYITLPVKAGYTSEVIDYIGGKLSANTGTDDFTDPENAADGDNDTKAVFTGTNSPKNAELTVTFPETNYETLSSILFKAKVRVAISSPNAVVSVTGYGETYEIPSTSGADAVISRTATSIPETITFNFDDDTGLGTGFYAWLYEVQIVSTYNMLEMNDLYVNCYNALDTQREIIEDICDDVGITYTDNSDVTEVTYGFTMDKQKKAIDHIKSLAIDGACVPFVNSSNALKLLKVNLADTVDKEIQKGDIVKIVCSETSLSQIVNDMEIGYKYDNYTNGMTENETDSNTSSITIHNETMSKSIVSGYYQATPATLLDYYVNGTSETLFSQVRNKIEITTNSILGVLPYASDGTFEPLIMLEMGDVIGVDDSMDDIQKCNGESWTSKKFIIFGLEIGVGYMKIKGLEL